MPAVTKTTDGRLKKNRIKKAMKAKAATSRAAASRGHRKTTAGKKAKAKR